MTRQDKFGNNILPVIDQLFRLAFSITKNKGDAEDVVQDVLFNVWKKKAEWENIENMEAYCFRSTRNMALDKLALKENSWEEIPENYDYPAPGEDIHRKIEVDEQMNLLEKWVENLPEKQQTIFRLREVEELSYKEIAIILSISEEQVKVNLFRLRRKLKEYFDSI
ncbi:MAG: sigma-70 family RNA polymerase sigma factor [Dysgonamonadaceae bacterium]|jgi:RNA polymerase sigma-70 factor (ECF subfamily)|nr:sigma-70 family RNA polymerase sigma factor [Dysgonamonadaceae bacterium]